MRSVGTTIVQLAAELDILPRETGRQSRATSPFVRHFNSYATSGRVLVFGVVPLIGLLSAIAFVSDSVLVPASFLLSCGILLLGAILFAWFRVAAMKGQLRSLREAAGSFEESRERLLEDLPLFALAIGQDGTLSYANQRLRAAAIVDEDVIGESGAVLAQPSKAEHADRPAAIAAQRPGGPPIHTRLRSRSGKGLHVLWFAPESAPALRFGLDITQRMECASARDRLQTELESLKKEVEESHKYLETDSSDINTNGMVGESSPIRYVLHKIGQVASTDATVLIEGETGVGKELVARTIHDNSPRRCNPLVSINCAALPANLIESELFGHEKGSFTGADRAKPGRFEQAQGGTIFLDEIGEMPLDLQAKLLRVLQEGEFTRLGGTRTLRSNVRVIVATNVNLAEAVKQGLFRKDLYYRLQVFPISVPPLRERREDIPALTRHLVSKLALKLQRPVPEIPLSTVERFVAYDWPGNVRELANVLENAIITSTGSVLSLPKGFGTMHTAEQGQPAHPFITINEMERQYIETVLKSVGGRIAGQGGAAEILGLHPNTLRGRMAKLNARRPASISESVYQPDLPV